VRPECQHCAREPSEYLRELYYDTVVFDEAQIGWLVRKYGADHVLLGTDHPFDMGEPDPVGLVDRVPFLTPEEREKIVGRNAERLLGLRG
jgi:aminocarboxymuconate-semialdehyde decarboxylase